MNKKNIVITCMFFLFILILINRYVSIEYNFSLLEYFSNSNEITDEERAWLNERGGLVFGADQNSPPLRFVDKESRQYKGFVVDYIQGLSFELGTKIEFKPLVWSDALVSLAKGTTDLCDMFPSPERGKFFLFSDPIYNMRGVVLAPQGSKNINTFRDLAQKAVAAPKGDYVIEFLKSKVDDIRFSYTPDMYSALLLLRKGEVSAVVGDEPVIGYFLDQMGIKGDYRFLDPPLYEQNCVLAVPKSEEVLLGIINKGIYHLETTDIMEKIQQKWFGISTPLSKEKASDKIVLISLIFLSAFLLVLYLFYSWNKLLKHEVAKRTEELYNIKNDLQTTFDGLTYFMIVLDVELRIVNMNEAFCKFMKQDRDDLIGQSFKDFPGVLNIEKNRQIVERTFSDRIQGHAEFEYQGKIYETSTFPLEDHLQIVQKVLLIIKDVTKERMSEKQLLHANKMAAIGQLAAGVTHEIRNPLGLIRNYCYVLKKSIDMKNPDAHKAVDAIERSIHNSSNIIENLLNFSRMSGDKWENVNIYGMIDRILKLQYKASSKKNIHILISGDKDLACYINQESISLVLINLVANAINALPVGGQCRIDFRNSGGALEFVCADNGAGIKAEDLNHIFDPFFTTKARGKGTGLGLYIAYNEVQKCGGRIEAASDPDQGTSFNIKIPLTDVNER